MDPRTPVLVGAAQITAADTPNEPIDMMVGVARAAMADSAGSFDGRVQSVRVVRGINPYRNPAQLVADELGCPAAHTMHTQIGGQEAYDLVNRTAADIQAGELDVALICGAEAMRTRRADKAAGGRTSYRAEPDDAQADETQGSPEDFWDERDTAARTNTAVNFYALAESARRHRLAESVEEHRNRISALWADAATVAADNPNAVLRSAPTAEEIRTPTDRNRMVADPYPKLMTSNVNVDMAAAVLVCSVAAAEAAGVPRDRWIFPLAGAGAHDHWQTRTRWELDRSPAMAHAGGALLAHLDLPADAFDHVDLYSCFPVAVQVGQQELGRSADTPFTITGGLTFNGGPLNTYCLHPLARAVDLLRTGGGSALLTGNGGFFTKHSFVALSDSPGVAAFRSFRPQDAVNALPARPLRNDPTASGTIEAHTVLHARDGSPDHGILAVLGDDGARSWARTDDAETVQLLRSTDVVGTGVTLDTIDQSPPIAHLS